MLDERAGDPALSALRDTARGRQADRGICDHHGMIGHSSRQSRVADNARAGPGQGRPRDADVVDA
eukprot:5638029-Lingulodinium_polyedra.AAC.1